MSGSQKDKSAGGPKAGSSLTDAVAAALATVDGPGDAPSETGAKADAASGAPPPPVVSAPPPMVSSQPAPSEAPKANGSNGKGFRTGAGSFSDLVRRWEAGQTAPVLPAGSSAPPPPEPEPEPAKAEPSSPPPPKEEPEAAAKVEAAPEPEPTPDEKPVELKYYGCTDVGLVREHNEDNFTVADLGAQIRDGDEPRDATVEKDGIILAVCDGMGGAAAGEVASQMAVDTIHELMSAGGTPKDRDDFARRLVTSIEEAGHRIFSAAKMDRSRRGMGTTTTLAGLIDNVLFVGQVGDSRAYVLRKGELVQITKDQSLVNQLIEAGQLTEDEAEAFEHSNIILQALGTTEEVTVDLTFLELRKGDRLLLCSDGLSGLVHADMIREVLEDNEDQTEAAAQLIQMANGGGGHDNITVIVADFDGEGLAAPGRTKVVYQQYPLPPDESAGAAGAARATRMKASAQKPGADVKRGIASIPPVGGLDGGAGTSKMPLLMGLGAVALLGILLVVGGVVLMGGDSDEDTAETVTTPVEDEPTVAADEAATRAAAEAAEAAEAAAAEAAAAEAAAAEETAAVTTGTIEVTSDIEDGTLFVNGESRGALSENSSLELDAPNQYELSVRIGDNPQPTVTESVSLEPGATESVELNMPEGAEEPPEEPARPAATERPRTRLPRNRTTSARSRQRPPVSRFSGGSRSTSPSSRGGFGGGRSPSGGGRSSAATTPDNPF